MTDFEVFHRAQPTKTTTPVVKITPRGQMILNEAACTALGRPKAVELLFAEQVAVMAIRGLDDPDGPTAFPLRVLRSGDGSHALHAEPFLDRWNLEVHDAPRSWPGVMDHGLLRVDLNKPGTLTDQVMTRPTRGAR